MTYESPESFDAAKKRSAEGMKLLQKEIEKSNAQAGRFQSDLRQAQARSAAISLNLQRVLENRTLSQRLFGWVPKKIDTGTMFAANEIAPNGESYGWAVSGSDPQLIVSVCTNAPFIRLVFRAKIRNETNSILDQKFQIYFDFGDGYSEGESQSFYFTGNEIKVDTIISLRRPLISLRVDPSNRPCSMELSAFELYELGDLTARIKLARGRIEDSIEAGRFKSDLKTFTRGFVTGRGREQIDRLFRKPDVVTDLYQLWVRSRHIGPALRKQLADKAATFKLQPRISVIMPAYNSRPEYLLKAVESVMAQTYENWELCIVEDGSPEQARTKQTLKAVMAREPRIKVQYAEKNRGIAGASNEAAKMATGEYIAFLDHDDELTPHALHAVVDAINRTPDADWLYSDEDKIDEEGRRAHPFFKPDWSPAYFLSCMYTCHFSVYRKALFDRLGGLDPSFDFAQDYDFALRVASTNPKVVHIPDVLYHWRTLAESTASGADAKPTAELAARRAVQGFIDRSGHKGIAEPGPVPGMHRPKFEIDGNPLVSIAIPSAGRNVMVEDRPTWFLLELVRSIREKSTYPNIEIVVADNDDFDQDLVKAIEPYVDRIVHYKKPVFNIAEKMNLVVGAASGDHVVIMNDDMTVITPDWIQEMLMWSQQEGVVGVGAKLLFPNRTVQHAGVLLLRQGPSHPYYCCKDEDLGYAGNAAVGHELSAVTGACMMVRKDDYFAVGGFDPKFRINYNDVDFCLKLIDQLKGRIVWTPYAKIFHYESVSREEAPAGELQMFNDRWSHVVQDDPFYNRHLSPTSVSYDISARIRSVEEDYLS